MATEESRTREGIIEAIEWLQRKGLPILAAKMERELLHANERVESASTAERLGITFRPHA